MNGLANFVALERNRRKWLVLSDPRKIAKTIEDPLDGKRKEVEVRRWTVTREDGHLVNKTFDVMSNKLDAQLITLYNLGVMGNKEIGIMEMGEGFTKNWEIETRPFQV